MDGAEPNYTGLMPTGDDAGEPGSDAQIAQFAESRLRWNTALPRDAIKVSVRDGIAVLEGRVERAYQRDAAARTLHGLRGLRGIDNRLEAPPS